LGFFEYIRVFKFNINKLHNILFPKLPPHINTQSFIIEEEKCPYDGKSGLLADLIHIL